MTITMMIRYLLLPLQLLLLVVGVTTATTTSSTTILEVVQNIPDGVVPHNFFALDERVLMVVDNEPRAISRGRSGLLDALPLKSGSSQILQYYGLNSTNAVFVARDGGALQLWGTDGTYGGTDLLHTFVMKFNRRRPPKFTVFREELYFVQGPQLWKFETAFSADRPVQIHDLSVEGGDEEVDESIYTLYVWKDNLYVSMGNNGGLFRTDGTPEGLERIASDVSVKFQKRQPTLDNSMYFITTGKQLWRTDGTPANTGLVAADKLQFTEVVDLFQHPVNNRIIFGLGDSKKPHLFSTDGTSEGTAPLQVDLEDGFVFEETVLPASELYTVDFRSFGETFYFPGQIASSRVVPLADNRLAFTVDGAGPLTTGFSLWTTDGKSAQIVHEFFDTIPYDILDLEDGRLLIRTNDPDEIWMSDGYDTDRLYSSVYDVDIMMDDTDDSNGNTTSSYSSSVYELEDSWRGKYWAMLSETELLVTGYNYHYYIDNDVDDDTNLIDGGGGGGQPVVQQEVEVLKVNIPSLRDSQISISKQQASSGGAPTPKASLDYGSSALLLLSTWTMAYLLMFYFE